MEKRFDNLCRHWIRRNLTLFKFEAAHNRLQIRAEFVSYFLSPIHIYLFCWDFEGHTHIFLVFHLHLSPKYCINLWHRGRLDKMSPSVIPRLVWQVQHLAFTRPNLTRATSRLSPPGWWAECFVVGKDRRGICITWQTSDSVYIKVSFHTHLCTCSLSAGMCCWDGNIKFNGWAI